MIFSYFNYFVVIFVVLAGLFIMCFDHDYIKRLIGMSIFQVAILLFYISLGYIENSAAPILNENFVLYSNPLPHVLMLTAIVVGVATLSVGLSLVIKIKQAKND